MRGEAKDVERKLLLAKLDEILSELDALVEDEAAEELAAELEDAIFLLECAEDDEETEGALEEIAALGDQLEALAGQDDALARIARKLELLLHTV